VAFLRTSDFSVAHLAVASGSGDYSGAVPPGSYYLYTVDPTGRHRAGFHGAPAIVNATQGNTIDVDPAMAALRGSIIGSITEDGTGSPVLGGWAVAASKATGAPLAGALVDGNGHFHIDGLRPGNDFVIYVDRTGAHVSEYYSDTHDANAAAPIVVTAAGTATANGSLASQSTTPGSAQLTGTVTEDGSGAPLGGVVVGALRASDYSFRKAEVTDGSGRYALSVPPGDYKMVFFDRTGDHNMEWYSNQPFDGLANAASVSAPNLTDVGLGLATGRLSGTVTHAAGGSPSSGAMVVAIDSNGGIAGGTLTAADGTFTVGGLIPGTYRATILDPNGGGTQEYWDNSPTYNGSTPFTITAGATVTITAALTYP
jgi:hypothetical protein